MYFLEWVVLYCCTLLFTFSGNQGFYCMGTPVKRGNCSSQASFIILCILIKLHPFISMATSTFCRMTAQVGTELMDRDTDALSVESYQAIRGLDWSIPDWNRQVFTAWHGRYGWNSTAYLKRVLSEQNSTCLTYWEKALLMEKGVSQSFHSVMHSIWTSLNLWGLIDKGP